MDGMEIDAFWNAIGAYNQATWGAQIVILAVLALSYALALAYEPAGRFLKAVLGVTNLFIGVVFFARFGTEPIQRYFALPLYLLVGGLFLYSAVKRGDDRLRKPSPVQAALMLSFILYPLASYLLGHRFPAMVLHVMPCPVITASIAIYYGYSDRNLPLMSLLTVWGLTGVKALFFDAFEDTILLVAGIYSLVETIRVIRARAGSPGAASD